MTYVTQLSGFIFHCNRASLKYVGKPGQLKDREVLKLIDRRIPIQIEFSNQNKLNVNTPRVF